MGNTEQWQSAAEQIEIATNTVYAEYAAAAGLAENSIHEGMLCAELSMLGRERLYDRGFKSSLRLYVAPTNAHYYLYTEEGLAVDLTWQQFLVPSKRSPNLPRALIWPQKNIRQRLGALGISRRRFPIWEQAEPSYHRWQDLQDPVLERLLGMGTMRLL